MKNYLHYCLPVLSCVLIQTGLNARGSKMLIEKNKQSDLHALKPADDTERLNIPVMPEGLTITKFAGDLKVPHRISDSISAQQQAPAHRWVPMTAGYRSPLNRQKIINSGHGFYAEAGLNLGRLISKTSLAGIYVGWAMMDKFWNTGFNRDFLAGYNAATARENDLSPDINSTIKLSSEQFSEKRGRSVTAPGCEMNSFHDYALYAGIIVKPIQGLPLVAKLYGGSSRTHMQGSADLSDSKDYTILQIRRPMLGTEIMLSQWFKNKPVNKLLNSIGLSVYYECRFMKNATLYFDNGSRVQKIPFSGFTSSQFINSYNNDHLLGLKLSLDLL